MRYRIGVSRAVGTLATPPSKSMAHRALICAALSEGESILSPIALSEDMLATMDALTALGAVFTREGERVHVKGTGGRFSSQGTLSCRESGSTLRFLIPLCLLTGKEHLLTGAPRLLERPLGVYETLCRENGFLFSRDAEGLRVKGRLSAGKYAVDGSVSSQFITGLLFALSLLPEDSFLQVTGDFQSASYVDLTLSAMASFGVKAERKETGFYIPGGQTYTAREYEVEGDYSNAAFPEALSLLGGEVTLTGLREDSLQGDRVYRAYFNALQKGFCTLSLADCPDLAPILFVVAACSHGARFTDTSRLAVKESDRGEAMRQEMAKCGVTLVVKENEILVPKGTLAPPTEPICGHNDHRIVMAMTVLLTRLGGVIDGAEAVTKSYPDFFGEIKKLGIEVNLI